MAHYKRFLEAERPEKVYFNESGWQNMVRLTSVLAQRAAKAEDKLKDSSASSLGRSLKRIREKRMSDALKLLELYAQTTRWCELRGEITEESTRISQKLSVLLEAHQGGGIPAPRSDPASPLC
uniref:Uncharacterized protein n=1 Tax=Chromera velia CCMP2878 TaxID=1169474 RepID=A0A0G4HKQ6_9ALVE|mmetsp:Transcript_20590/g.41149  ORF Transcript_20590/g.41149 Transcript_20590/m.41149 type:complete len:123 (-) Transcript_20590:227-595(-)|eukprot:Cvel_7249.t1-p1 / transcript=Cvel_7249.t1 / gene=Cvel_7249 / organism=Chromera_velia_CCMP2878 / gene_product=hypothetical protein / transcript_product=hypothetical protein / location=Cvel_scaffold374:33355-34217(+) / protein_length=122 / sequence_SO=supercontig / SO=protein_coding / is_pseudo=false